VLNVPRRKDNKIYAIYNGDKFLALGTLDEIAKELKIKRKTVQWYMQPAYKKRSRGLFYAVVKIED
jgi:hypothetical protein